MLRNSETVSAIMNEWRSIDFSSAAQQATFNHQISEHNVDLFQECKLTLPTNYEKFRQICMNAIQLVLQCNINACISCKNLYNACHDNYCTISAIIIIIVVDIILQLLVNWSSCL